MRNITLILLLFSVNLLLSQKSVIEVKPYEELTKEELFQAGRISAIDSYNDEIPNIVLGVFAGSFAIDAVAAKEVIKPRQWRRWTKKLDLDDKILNDEWFIEGFITERKEQIIESIRVGRLATRVVATAATFYLLTEIDDIGL